jgi:hypothetical protein
MSENELMHYGVKGMKWGVRKASYYESKIGRATRKNQSLERKASRLEKRYSRRMKNPLVRAGDAFARFERRSAGGSKTDRIKAKADRIRYDMENNRKTIQFMQTKMSELNREK